MFWEGHSRSLWHVRFALSLEPWSCLRSYELQLSLLSFSVPVVSKGYGGQGVRTCRYRPHFQANCLLPRVRGPCKGDVLSRPTNYSLQVDRKSSVFNVPVGELKETMKIKLTFQL